MRPRPDDLGDETISISLSWSSCVRFSARGIGIVFFGCVIWALLFDFENATETHCTEQGTLNVLPSISSAVGRPPQMFFWRIIIAICIVQRCADGFMFRSYYQAHMPRHQLNNALNNAVWVFHQLEQAGLTLLTFVSSKEDHQLHEVGFGLFATASLVHMLLQCALHHQLQSARQDSATFRESYIRKKKMAAGGFSSFAAAMVSFYLHNATCGSFLFSAFGFFEYLLVTFNILFHISAAVDFEGLVLFAGSPKMMVKIPHCDTKDPAL
mmetsp:Transcript_12719/g.29239  ORF Transcript_12719/g.29239 Transcript_12719/m.29239 type:complete len:268 (+) Transcript_12719:55-858(+)